MNPSERDPELQRLFREAEESVEGDLRAQVDARIDRDRRLRRVGAILLALGALTALALSMPWLTVSADLVLAALRPQAQAFDAAIVSPGAIVMALVALALAVPWLWLICQPAVRPQRRRVASIGR